MPTLDALLDQLDRDATALAARLRTADLDAAVPSCPDWDVRRLVRHLGRVHRWATEIVRTGAEAESGPAPDGDPALLDWFEQGGRDLVSTLRAADPDAPCWTFGPQPQLTSFWVRRQAHETAVHRWDAGAALGEAGELPDWLAEDGVDEVVAMFFPRQVRLGRRPALADTVALVSSGTGRTWTLAGDGTGAGAAPHTLPDATVTAPATTLDLMLWHRAQTSAPGVRVDGDVAAAARVLASALTP